MTHLNKAGNLEIIQNSINTDLIAKELAPSCIFLHLLFDSDVPVLGRDVKEMGNALTIGCAKSFHRDAKFRYSLQEHGPFMSESARGFGI